MDVSISPLCLYKACTHECKQTRRTFIFFLDQAMFLFSTFTQDNAASFCGTITSPPLSVFSLMQAVSRSQSGSISWRPRQANPDTGPPANLTLHSDNTDGQLFRDYTFSKSDSKGRCQDRGCRETVQCVLHRCKCNGCQAHSLLRPLFSRLLCISGQPDDKHASRCTRCLNDILLKSGNLKYSKPRPNLRKCVACANKTTGCYGN